MLPKSIGTIYSFSPKIGSYFVGLLRASSWFYVVEKIKKEKKNGPLADFCNVWYYAWLPMYSLPVPFFLVKLVVLTDICIPWLMQPWIQYRHLFTADVQLYWPLPPDRLGKYFLGGIGFLIALPPDNGVVRVWGLGRLLRLAGSGLMMLCCCVLMLERVHDCNLLV